MVLWEYDNAKIQIDDLPNGKRYITVNSLDQSRVIPTKNCVTSYPIELIEQILKIKGPDFLIDEIQRDEDRFYLEWRFRKNLFGFIPKSFFDNKKFLDFGCGCGASSMILARMFPKSFIVGIDIADDLLSIAKLRAKYYGFTNCRFILSSENNLSTDLGDFDFIVLSAVYEHLLPNERKTLLPQIWSLLNPSGVLFIIDIPHRYFPVEIHTTGLPLINYFPDRIALAVARRWSKRVKFNESWASLLRRGIRGGHSERDYANFEQ
jgi:2-polyprenyl-3-methyl-5-hydroxy-6-metoxy-1,4-benzoquinol methylase